MVGMLSFRKRNPRRPDEKDRFQFYTLFSLSSDLVVAKAGVHPFASAPLRLGTIQRELGHLLIRSVFPAQMIYSPSKTWRMPEDIDPGVNSVARNRFTFPLVSDLLPGNLLLFQHFRVLIWDSVPRSR